MIQLSIKRITPTTQTHLKKVQADINSKPSFKDMALRAYSLWDSKESTVNGKSAFLEIKDKLTKMCVGEEICNYCENNEATDVEHIYPKKLYPVRTFKWSNYLLACKTCNTKYKRDHFAIFHPYASSILQKIPPTKGIYSKPQSCAGAIINPRVENGLNFLWLDILADTFHFVPLYGISPRDELKAKYTCELLKLNKRSSLVKARRSAYNYYIDRLEMYVKIKNANTFIRLKNIVRDNVVINTSVPIATEKKRLTVAIRNEIKSYAHPTVWKEMIRQRAHLTTANKLFKKVPKALTW